MLNVKKIWHFKPKNLNIWNCKSQKLQIFLQLCYGAILHVELHDSTIAKENINILSKYQFYLSFTRFSSLSLYCWSFTRLQPTAQPTQHHRSNGCARWRHCRWHPQPTAKPMVTPSSMAKPTNLTTITNRNPLPEHNQQKPTGA